MSCFINCVCCAKTCVNGSVGVPTAILKYGCRWSSLSVLSKVMGSAHMDCPGGLGSRVRSGTTGYDELLFYCDLVV